MSRRYEYPKEVRDQASQTLDLIFTRIQQIIGKTIEEQNYEENGEVIAMYGDARKELNELRHFLYDIPQFVRVTIQEEDGEN